MVPKDLQNYCKDTVILNDSKILNNNKKVAVCNSYWLSSIF